MEKVNSRTADIIFVVDDDPSSDHDLGHENNDLENVDSNNLDQDQQQQPLARRSFEHRLREEFQQLQTYRLK